MRGGEKKETNRYQKEQLLLRSSLQAGGWAVVGKLRSRAPLWKALINPDLSGVLTRGAKHIKSGRGGGGEAGGGLAVCLLKCYV